MNLTDCQASDLADLHTHWGEVYQFSTDGDTWSASPRADLAKILTAESAQELRLAIRKHYSASPAIQRQPRDHDDGGRCWCGERHAEAN